MSAQGSRWPLLGVVPLVTLVILLAGCGPSDPVAEVRRLHEAGRFPETLEPLRELLDERRDDPEVHFLYGLTLARTGDPSLAVFAFRKAMLSPDWVAAAGTQLALSALRSGNFDTATESLDRVLEAEPDNVLALILRAQARAQSRRDYEGAIADADRALELDPDRRDALVPRTIALLGLERTEEAAEALAELESRFSDDDLGLDTGGRFCAAQASFVKEKGDIEEAERRYDACLEDHPANPTLVEAAVKFFDAQKNAARSIEILRRAAEEDPLARPYRISLVLHLRGLGDEKAAEAVLREAAESITQPGPAAAVAWADVAGYLAEQGRHEEAVQAFESAMAQGTTPRPELVFSYADALVVAGELEKALELADQMSLPAHRHLVRGRVLLEQGRPAEALEELEAGHRLWPDNAVSRYYAAVAAERSGDFDRAIAEYRYAVRIDPAATDARLRLAHLHVAEGSYGLALTILRQFADRKPGDLEMALLEIRLLAQLGMLQTVPPRLVALVSAPSTWPRAVAAQAEGTRERSGPAAGAAIVQRAERLDLAQPESAPALRALVEFLAEAGRADAGLQLSRTAVDAHPESAVLHEIAALALARSGAPAGEVRVAYEKAVALDAANARALAGLATLTQQSGDVEAALLLWQRAAEAAPGDAAYGRATAEALATLGKARQAEERLASVLDDHPYDAPSALALARLRMARGARDARTFELAQRAVRFGGGGDAEALLDELEEEKLADVAAPLAGAR